VSEDLKYHLPSSAIIIGSYLFTTCQLSPAYRLLSLSYGGPGGLTPWENWRPPNCPLLWGKGGATIYGSSWWYNEPQPVKGEGVILAFLTPQLAQKEFFPLALLAGHHLDPDIKIRGAALVVRVKGIPSKAPSKVMMLCSNQPPSCQLSTGYRISNSLINLTAV
jgi:hypothetical protein